MYHCPAYIPESVLSEPRIHFEWDDEHPQLAYYGVSRELLAKLAPLYMRAKIACAIGIYEWIACRFARLHSDNTPELVVNAAWCASISRNYVNDFEVDREGWHGPIRGPIWSATIILSELIFLHEEDPNPAVRVAWLSKLALHVLPEFESFQQWQTKCLERLAALYSTKESGPFENLFDNDWGPFVPPEAIDPEYPYDPAKAENLIQQFLRKVDHRSNPFLNSPETMIEEDFDGTPYT